MVSTPTAQRRRRPRRRRRHRHRSCFHGVIFYCSIGERGGWLLSYFTTHRTFRFMVWQGSLGKGKRHGAFMISRRLPRGTLVLIFKIKFVHGKWHPLGPFPRPPPCPSLPGRVVVMVMKGGNGGAETGEMKTETKIGETKTEETKTREEGTLCCCGGKGWKRQSQQQPSTHISTPLPLPVLQSSIGFSVSARHRRDNLPPNRRRQLQPGPTG